MLQPSCGYLDSIHYTFPSFVSMSSSEAPRTNTAREQNQWLSSASPIYVTTNTTVQLVLRLLNSFWREVVTPRSPKRSKIVIMLLLRLSHEFQKPRFVFLQFLNYTCQVIYFRHFIYTCLTYKCMISRLIVAFSVSMFIFKLSSIYKNSGIIS